MCGDFICIRLEMIFKQALLCGDFICIRLEMIFKQALHTGVFRSKCKNGNIVLIHKKINKQNIENYRLLFLLPICGNIFEGLMFNEMLNYFSANKLISKN